jgi:hypothetical protein
MSDTPTAPRSQEATIPPQQTRGQEEITRTPTTPSRRAEAPEPGVWAGWIIFGSVMLMLMGSFQLILGITALVHSGYYAVPSADLLVSVNYTAWGWTHVALGALAWAAAFGLLVGAMWARVSAVVLAGLSALVNMAFVEAYPLWSLTVIVLNVIVIYAITTHGAELKNTRG